MVLTESLKGKRKKGKGGEMLNNDPSGKLLIMIIRDKYKPSRANNNATIRPKCSIFFMFFFLPQRHEIIAQTGQNAKTQPIYEIFNPAQITQHSFGKHTT